MPQRSVSPCVRLIHSPQHRILLSRASSDVDLYFNANPEFTKWVVKSGFLEDRFVVIDVGVLGGENPRWHFLREYLVVHGFDAIKEVIEELHRTSWDPRWYRTYHWLAIGNENGNREFFVDPAQPTRSSLGFTNGLERRVVPMRTLDALWAERAIPQPDFIKIDVEGHEGDVLSGARQILAAGGVLGMEVETNFTASPAYPKSHFNTIHDLVLGSGLRLFDLNFDRAVRPIYEAARNACPSSESTAGAGTPATFNVLFCRDMIAEREGSSFYEGMPPLPTVDQLKKMMIIYELHGLTDVAVDTAIKFSRQLKTRFAVEDAIERLCK
jgi:FkbM family methyltransferase